MKRLPAWVFIPVLLSCTPKMAPRETVPVKSSMSVTGNNMEGSILSLINDHRRSKGLADLLLLDAANEQAYIHSKEMATGKTVFGHDGFEQRVNAIKKSMATDYISASAENVAEGQLSAAEVVKGWLNSPGHKRNIEGNYNLTGIGVYPDRKGNLYFTQIFLRK